MQYRHQNVRPDTTLETQKRPFRARATGPEGEDKVMLGYLSKSGHGRRRRGWLAQRQGTTRQCRALNIQMFQSCLARQRPIGRPGAWLTILTHLRKDCCTAGGQETSGGAQILRKPCHRQMDQPRPSGSLDLLAEGRGGEHGCGEGGVPCPLPRTIHYW
jgi:hypothetical protein